MKRALPLLAAGLLALACPPPPEEPAPTPPAGGAAERSGSALEKLARAVLNPRGTAAAQTPDQRAQKQTVADIRNTGTAMFSWLTDEVAAGAAGQGQAPEIDLAAYPRISHAELTELLVPQYIVRVPEKDDWGHPYEYFLNAENVLAKEVMSIRSPGRDGQIDAELYTVTNFDPSDYDRDIVWSDGFFVRWPQGPPPRP
jgi:hypothetical protein